MVLIERDTRAIIAWRLNQLPLSNGRYKALRRQLNHINARLVGLTLRATSMTLLAEGTAVTRKTPPDRLTLK
jgi:hypothetical protein